MYFAELNPNAFLENGIPRWKFMAVNTSVITSYVSSYSFSAVVNAVFNFNFYKIHDSWKSKFYMQAANKWMKKKPSRMTWERLQCLLIESIRNLGIEHFHYSGDNASQFGGPNSKGN